MVSEESVTLLICSRGDAWRYTVLKAGFVGVMVRCAEPLRTPAKSISMTLR